MRTARVFQLIICALLTASSLALPTDDPPPENQNPKPDNKPDERTKENDKIPPEQKKKPIDDDHPPYPLGYPKTNGGTCIKNNGHIADRATEYACKAIGKGKYEKGTNPDQYGFTWKACLDASFDPDADMPAWHQACVDKGAHGRICFYPDQTNPDPNTLDCKFGDCFAAQTCSTPPN